MGQRAKISLGFLAAFLVVGGAVGVGTLLQHQLSADSIGSTGYGYGYGYGNPTTQLSRQLIDTFDGLANGQTSNLGWSVTKNAAGSAVIGTNAGKGGAGLTLKNSSTRTGYDDLVLISRSIPTSDSGTFSFDVLPHQSNGTLTMVLGGSTGALDDTYLWYDGTLRYPNTASGRVDQIGKLTYTANSWNHVTLTWSNGQVLVSVNGTGTTAIPYTYPNPPRPITFVEFIAGYGDGSHIGGTFDLDNISYPSK